MHLAILFHFPTPANGMLAVSQFGGQHLDALQKVIHTMQWQGKKRKKMR
jgi:hypothetical protein